MYAVNAVYHDMYAVNAVYHATQTALFVPVA